MSGHSFAADDLLTADDINLYLARDYQYTYNNTSTAVGTPLSAWNNYAGQLSATIEVNANGVLWVEWGFEGYNSNSATASVWVTPDITGANTSGPTVETAIRISSLGAAGKRMISRTNIYTGLTPGVTTVTLLGRIDEGTSASNFIDNQYLFVRNFQ